MFVLSGKTVQRRKKLKSVITYVLFVSQRQFVIPTALPAVGVQGAGLVDENNGEVHVYAHPSKVVNNLQHPKEREKV